MLSATSTIRIHFIIYLLWARRIHRRKHPAPTQTICDRAAPRSVQTWKGVTENVRVREGEEAVSQVLKIQTDRQTGRQNNSIYSVSDITMLSWVKKPHPSVMQTNIQTYKQTDSRPHSHKLMYEFEVKHIVFNEWGNHSTDTDWPVGVPILQHTVFAAGEEVVGFRLKAHTRHTVFVGYQWSVSERDRVRERERERERERDTECRREWERVCEREWERENDRVQ